MSIPIAEAKAWGTIFAEEFTTAPAPYFGVNIFDVPVQHWEAVLSNVRQQLDLAKTLGGESYLWAVRDHGQHKRVLWINRYPQSLKDHRSFIAEFSTSQLWLEFCSLIDSYQWFLVTQQPSVEP